MALDGRVQPRRLLNSTPPKRVSLRSPPSTAGEHSRGLRGEGGEQEPAGPTLSEDRPASLYSACKCCSCGSTDRSGAFSIHGRGVARLQSEAAHIAHTAGDASRRRPRTATDPCNQPGGRVGLVVPLCLHQLASASDANGYIKPQPRVALARPAHQIAPERSSDTLACSSGDQRAAGPFKSTRKTPTAWKNPASTFLIMGLGPAVP